MSLNIKDWVEAIKLKPRYLFAIFSLGIILLCSNTEIASLFGFYGIRENIKPWIGLITIFSGLLWIIHGVSKVYEIVISFLFNRSEKKRITQRMASLSNEEKELLKYFISNNQQTVYLSAIDPVAHSLCEKDILEKAGGEGSILNWPYTIPDWLWIHLKRSDGL